MFVVCDPKGEGSPGCREFCHLFTNVQPITDPRAEYLLSNFHEFGCTHMERS